MKNKKPLILIVLALLAVTVIMLYGLFKDKDNLKPEALDLVITIAQDEFEIDDEPLSAENVFNIKNAEDAVIEYMPETLDISQVGEYIVKIKVIRDGKVYEETVSVKVVEKLEVIEQESEVDDTGCEHKFGSLFNPEGWNKWETIKEPTCLTNGTKERTRTCNKCGYTQKETAVIPATGHKMDKGAVTKEATCTEDGLKVFTCTVCGSTTQEVIKSLGHDWDKGTVTKEPTCTETGTKTTTCKRCGITETQSIPAKGHNFGNWTQTVAPTCTSDGKETRTCKTCGHIEERTVAKLGHDYSAWNTTKEPTCTATGTKERTCSRCSDKQVETIPALGHNYSAWTTTKQPTCSEEGIKERTCSKCSHKETQSIPMLEHQYGEWELHYPPSCSEMGIEIRVCQICGVQHKRTVPKLSHEPTYDSPTESQKVAWKVKCNACGEIFESTLSLNDALDKLTLHQAQTFHGGYDTAYCYKPKCSVCSEILWDEPSRWNKSWAK